MTNNNNERNIKHDKNQIRIIFTDSLGEMDFISMPGSEFVKLANQLGTNILFSAYDGRNIGDDYLYMIYQGIIFVPRQGDTEELEQYLGVDRSEFPDLYNWLLAQKFGASNYQELKEFKESEFFGDDKNAFINFLEAKKK
ncbi:MAG: hypothetical protein ACTSVV_08300 [Promethearchaeota archaeon]